MIQVQVIGLSVKKGCCKYISVMLICATATATTNEHSETSLHPLDANTLGELLSLAVTINMALVLLQERRAKEYVPWCMSEWI